jgi:hypothetical protein
MPSALGPAALTFRSSPPTRARTAQGRARPSRFEQSITVLDGIESAAHPKPYEPHVLTATADDHRVQYDWTLSSPMLALTRISYRPFDLDQPEWSAVVAQDVIDLASAARASACCGLGTLAGPPNGSGPTQLFFLLRGPAPQGARWKGLSSTPLTHHLRQCHRFSLYPAADSGQPLQQAPGPRRAR